MYLIAESLTMQLGLKWIALLWIVEQRILCIQRCDSICLKFVSIYLCTYKMGNINLGSPSRSYSARVIFPY